MPADTLHGAVLRLASGMAWDGSRYGGPRLAQLKTPPAQTLPGVVALVQQESFVGVAAVAAVLARQALDQLHPVWIRAQRPASQDSASGAAAAMSRATESSPTPGTSEVGRSYRWTPPAASMPGGSSVVAWCLQGYATVWAPFVDVAMGERCRAELAVLLGWEPARITIVCMGAASGHVAPGPAGMGGGVSLAILDAAADAALLSRATERPVRMAVTQTLAPCALALHERPIRLSRTSSDHAGVQALDGGKAPAPCPGLGGETVPGVGASVFETGSPWLVRPSLARLLSQPDHVLPLERASAQSLVGIRPAPGASPLSNAGVAELNAAQVFAQESLFDEQARAQGVDPFAYRLDRQPPGPARDLARQVAERAGWRGAVDRHGDSRATGSAAGPAINPAIDPTSGSAPQSTPHASGALAPRAAEPAACRADGWRAGRGFAAACVDLGDAGQAWSAWVAEVAVDPASGQIEVTRVVVGHDSQRLGPAQGAAIQSDDEHLLATARRWLQAPRRFDDWGGSAVPQPVSAPSSDPVPQAPDLARALAPVAPKALSATQGPPPAVAREGWLAMDGVMTLPAAAAIANAICDATGVRLRQAPFDTEQLRLALAANGHGDGDGDGSAADPGQAPRGWLRRGWRWLAAGAGAVAGLIAVAWPVKAPIAPTAGPDVSVYSVAAIERGRLVAAAGDCVVCHTAPKGEPNAGGLGLETPFGTIYSTNITPDNDTGIGRWSYTAFERAMREGVHRDGRQLYPAFPYTAFAKMTDADMQALYAYLMSQPPVSSTPPRTELAFPYNLRPAMAGWNLLFHDNSVYQPDPTQSLEWNRGAYLVQGAGHCAACHSPRNALGAEKQGQGNYLAGGEAEGWQAPPLDRLASGKVPWTEEDLDQYLRTGFSARHGVAAGPMAPVIHGLAELPESDVRAITTYLMALPGTAPPSAPVTPDSAFSSASVSGPGASGGSSSPASFAAGLAGTPSAMVTPEIPAGWPLSVASPADGVAVAAPVFQAYVNGERLYQNACAVCHEVGAGPTLFGVKPLLAANTNVHGETPDNLIQVILHGIQSPANGDLGYMPGFKDSLDDQQVQDLLAYLRARFAPQQPPWTDTAAALRQLREPVGH